MNRSPLHHESWLRQQAVLGVLALSAAGPFALVASVVPHTLVLPSMCLLALSASALVAVLAVWRGATWRGETVTAWDVSAGLAFVGFCAAMLSEPAHILSPTAVAMN
jgi:hypothetical protein